jgi:hypothetical protein
LLLYLPRAGAEIRGELVTKMNAVAEKLVGLPTGTSTELTERESKHAIVT